MGSIMVMRGCMYSPGEALAKAKDPKMTTKDNPLFSGRMTSEDLIAEKNMERLAEDAARKTCPVHGAVYEGFMSTRFNSEE